MISIIIPTYNVSGYIEECLKSLMVQEINKADFEVIIIDDRSTDDTFEKIQLFEGQFKNFKINQNKKNAGISYTRNVGLSLRSKKSKFTVFIDSDDYISPNYLKDMRDKMKEGRVVISSAIVVDAYGSFVKDETHSANITKNKNFPFWGKVWRSMWNSNEIGEFSSDIRYYEDLFFSIKNCFQKEILIVDEAKYFYRKNSESVVNAKYTNEKFENQIKETIRSINFIKEKGNSGDLDDFMRYLSRNWIDKILFTKYSKKIKDTFKGEGIILKAGNKKESLLLFLIKTNTFLIMKPLFLLVIKLKSRLVK